jgi:chitinase
VRDDWGAGFVADVSITNNGSATTSGWQLEFDLDANITNIWNAEIVSHVGSHYVIRMASWNAKIAPGGTITFGFQASGSGRTAANMKLTLL